jgi:hypothetical protein
MSYGGVGAAPEDHKRSSYQHPGQRKIQLVKQNEEPAEKRRPHRRKRQEQERFWLNSAAA